MRRPFTVSDLLAIARVSHASVSPDGRHVVYQIARHDVERNRVITHIYRVPSTGGEPRQLTRAGNANVAARFSPDGATIAFVSDRSGSRQIWLMDLEGGDPRQLSEAKDGASGPAWTPDGRAILFASSVTPEGEAPHHRTATKLLYRHWDEWRDRTTNRAFRIEVATGRVTALSPDGVDCPPVALEGERDYDAAPFGDEVALTWNPDPQPAYGTNNTVFRASRGATTPASESRGCEVDPRYSPDGRHLAWLAMTRPGYEADLRHLWVLELATGEARCLTAGYDRPIRRYQWSRSGAHLLFDAQDRGRTAICRVALSGGEPHVVLDGMHAHLCDELPDGDLLLSIESMTAPAELYRLEAGTSRLEPLTAHNREALAAFDWSEGEDLWWQGADGDPVHGFLVKPPESLRTGSTPLLVLVHGGPQGAFAAHFHYRWNPQVFAGAGFAVLLVNPRGSTGYGQAFTDQITGDWAGRVMVDIDRGIDRALATHAELDPTRIAAAGGSFGGYTMNWLQGHSERFRALVCHAGIFNLWNMYYGTEELWFPEWELGGAPTDSPALYDRLSPCRFADRWKTPMLVLHGEHDFRVPVLEGIGAFTALQKNGVDSRLVLFPEEGHWITRPMSAKTWYDEITAWLARHCAA